jgi:methylmalonyl-CoA mutase C-terminal domain/subunit
VVRAHGALSAMPIRVVLGKVGLDGHDRGIQVVARILRDAGMEVVYAGLRQTPESLAAVALQEDADVVGISTNNGSHLTIAPAVVRALRDVGLDVPLVVGGTVPTADRDQLLREGVADVLGPGALQEEVVDAVRRAAAGADQ